MLCLFTLFSKLYSLHPNIYYRALFSLSFTHKMRGFCSDNARNIAAVISQDLHNVNFLWAADSHGGMY